MRIGIDIKAFKNGNTGIARYLKCLLTGIEKINERDRFFLFQPRPSSYINTNPHFITHSGNWRLPGILWQQFILPVLVNRYKIDALWSPEQVCPLFASRKIRIVTTFHDLAHLHYPEAFVTSTRVILTGSAPWVLRRSNHIITVSDYVRRELFDRYGNHINQNAVTAIPNGKPDWTLPGDYLFERRGDFLLYVGNLEPRKNLLTLIQALEILKTNNLRPELQIVGPKGWKNAELFNRLAASPVKDQIRWLGYLTDEELRQKYLTCKGFVYPSLYEGFGLPVLEALVSDCIVLTSKNTVMEEIAGRCCILFDCRSPASIAEAIGRLYEPGNPKTLLHQDKEKLLSRFSWERGAKRILQILRKNT